MGSRLIFALLAAAFAAGPADAASFTADKLNLVDVTGTVEIVSSSATDEIDVTIRQGKTYHRLLVSEDEGVVTLKGEKWREEETRDCCNYRITRTFDARKDRKLTTGAPVDEKFFADYPAITITMPRRGDVSFVDARVKLKMDDIDGALDLDACYVYGEAGDAGSAVIGVVEGSRLVMGDIGSGLEIDVSGDADVKTGSAASVDVDIAGTGDVILGDIDGMLDVSIAGSGSVRSTRLDGPLTARIAGSGAVAVKEGRADKLKAIIDGSGGVFFEGTAVRPILKLFGSSEVQMGAVEGRITRAGGGEVYVGGKLIERE